VAGVTEPPRLYVRRRGRITRGQARALTQGAGKWLLPFPAGPVDWSSAFARDAPLLLEVGSGMGHALLDTARAHPEWNCVGVDVYQPGIGATILQCESAQIDNVRLIEGDARLLLERGVGAGALARVHIFFPDPWPKKRHHKRRLVDAAFATLVAERLKPRGTLHVATDWQPYADEMLRVLDAEAHLRNLAGTGSFAASAERATTRFEARGVRLGHRVFDLVYERLD
jgi:tRNA (guanine-N7-)-methyltransferase